ncbi:hypothetical protein ACHAQA_007310 [Verticillium albo-atrum]
MAIDSAVPGIEAWVEVNGVRATEYQDDDGEQGVNELGARHQLCKYIESADNAVFTVQVDLTSHVLRNVPLPCDTLVTYLFVDGNPIRSTCSFVRPMLADPIRIHFEGKHVDSQYPGYINVNKLVFSAVSTVDDADTLRIENDLRTARNIGLIQLRFCVGTNRGPLENYHWPQQAENHASELAEKSLKGKAISHGTSFAKGQYQPSRGYVNMEYPYGSTPFAVFNFKYRSRRALQQELVIPRTPTPDPEQHVLEGLSAEEVRRLAAERVRSLGEPSRVKDESRTSVKRERDEVDLTGPRVKREWKYTRTESGARAVDLTEDDD